MVDNTPSASASPADPSTTTQSRPDRHTGSAWYKLYYTQREEPLSPQSSHKILLRALQPAESTANLAAIQESKRESPRHIIIILGHSESQHKSLRSPSTRRTSTHEHTSTHKYTISIEVMKAYEHPSPAQKHTDTETHANMKAKPEQSTRSTPPQNCNRASQ
jgi:hypothetical protein